MWSRVQRQFRSAGGRRPIRGDDRIVAQGPLGGAVDAVNHQPDSGSGVESFRLIRAVTTSTALFLVSCRNVQPIGVALELTPFNRRVDPALPDLRALITCCRVR